MVVKARIFIELLDIKKFEHCTFHNEQDGNTYHLHDKVSGGLLRETTSLFDLLVPGAHLINECKKKALEQINKGTTQYHDAIGPVAMMNHDWAKPVSGN